MKRWLNFVIFSILIFGLISSSILHSKPQPIPLTVAAVKQPVFALVEIAQSQGFFKSKGLDITYHHFDLGRDALDDMLQGNADLATVYDTPTVLRILENKPVAILTTLHTAVNNTALVTEKSRGLNHPRDLIGKKIGVPIGTSNEYFLSTLLANEGIPVSAVTLVNLDPAQMLPAFDAGQVDALVAWNPYLTALTQTIPPENLAVWYSDTFMETSVLAANLNASPDAYPAYSLFLQALSEAEDFVKTNPDEAIKIVSRSQPQLSEPDLRHLWPNLRFTLKLDNLLLSDLERQADWLNRKNPLPPSPPDFRAHLIPEPLKEIKPETVTVY